MKVETVGNDLLDASVAVNTGESPVGNMEDSPTTSSPPPKVIAMPISPVKIDGIAEIENVLRLIRRSTNSKDGMDGKGDVKPSLKALENGSPSGNSSNFAVDSPDAMDPLLPGTKVELPTDPGGKDMVDILRQMLDKALQALKICQNKISEANKRHESSQLEIQKLQDEVRNLRAQVNPPQLQMMKGLSSFKSRNKRRRHRSPSSSGSSSWSTSSSHHRSSRRSDSPPQLSPAFIPRPIPSSSLHLSSKRSRKDSPHSLSSESSDRENKILPTIIHDKKKEEPHLHDLGVKGRQDIAGPSSSYQRSLTEDKPLKNLKSNMKNTSHLSDVKPKTKFRRRSSKLFSESRRRMPDRYTFRSSSVQPSQTTAGVSTAPKGSLLSTLPTTSTSARGVSGSIPIKTYGSARRSISSRVQEKQSDVKANTSTVLSIKHSPTLSSSGKITRSSSKLVDPGPPALKSSADLGRDFVPRPRPKPRPDPFEALGDSDDENELPDIPSSSYAAFIRDVHALPPPPAMKTSNINKLTDKKMSSSSKLQRVGRKKIFEPLKMPGLRKPVSPHSSPFTPLGANRTLKSTRSISNSPSTGFRRFRSSTLSSRSPRTMKSASAKLLRNSTTKLRENRHSYPFLRKLGDKEKEYLKPQNQETVSPFPPRHFDKKIDYSNYLNGKSPMDSDSLGLFTSETFEPKEKSFRGSIFGLGLTFDPKVAKEKNEKRFAMRGDEEENCMMAQEPYFFYESESKLDFVEFEEETVKLEKKSARVVEIPRWRERLFEPLIDHHAHTDENLDDYAFLKRHSKNEINERRRKRWDSQRMREESYLERLKRKREERENQKKRKRRRGRGLQNDKSCKDDDVLTFQPLINDATYIRNDPELPIMVFGYPIPYIEPQEFRLPWLTDEELVKLTLKYPRKPRRQRQQQSEQSPQPPPVQVSDPEPPVAGGSGMKSALRQAKR